MRAFEEGDACALKVGYWLDVDEKRACLGGGVDV